MLGGEPIPGQTPLPDLSGLRDPSIRTVSELNACEAENIRRAVLHDLAALAAFVLLCLGGGAASGLATPPGDWYASLAKPSWTPPPWVFGPAWTVLYLLMAVAGWILWRGRAQPEARRALAAFAVQLALNLAWTPVFFGLHAPGAALAVIVALVAAIAWTIALADRASRTAAVLLVPYLGWVCFATALNWAIWRMN